jgi:Chalcone isomerase-like
MTKPINQRKDTIMKIIRSQLLTVAALFGALLVAVSTVGSAAWAAELAGAKLPDTLNAGGTTLKLNGLGIRKKSIVKVYVGALYLVAPSKDADAILAGDQPKAIRLHFLRDLTKKQLVEAFEEGFKANAPDQAGQQAAFDKMLALIPDVKEGETLTFIYVPGKGTTLQVGNKDLGVFAGKVFSDAVFSIWLGPKPPTEDLKKGMLG